IETERLLRGRAVNAPATPGDANHQVGQIDHAERFAGTDVENLMRAGLGASEMLDGQLHSVGHVEGMHEIAAMMTIANRTMLSPRSTVATKSPTACGSL